jgi:hypothetical protein
MLRKKKWLYLAMILCWTSTSSAAPLRVFVLAGQSNMSTGGAIADLPTEPIDFRQPQTDVPYHFWINQGDLHIAPDWSPLRALWPGYVGTTYASELTFGRAMADALPDEQIAIIKVAQGGTDLQNDWHPSGENGTLYRTMIDHVALALSQLEEQGHDPLISGFVWVQGEGDANNVTKATEYEQNLNTLVSSLRSDWGVIDLPVVFNLLHINAAKPATALAAIRQSQTNVAANDPLALLVNIDDLSLKGDFIHFTSQTHLELGYRFADVILPWLPALPLPGDMDLDDDVDFDDVDDFVLGLSDAAAYEMLHGLPPSNRGDLDQDGDIDFDDIALLVDLFQEAFSSGGAARAVPEPGAGSLGLFGLVMFVCAVGARVRGENYRRVRGGARRKKRVGL